MLRLALDTNVVLDLLHFSDAAAAPIERALREGRAVCFCDAACREELAQVLSRARFGISGGRIRHILDDYAALAQPCADCSAAAVVAAELPPLPLCRDPDDQKFLELARAARADFLVTKDKALLALAKKSARLGFRIAAPETVATLLA
ncbi:MAG: putative toxin-antitoxin system toxin component, PIN family [Zoogloeaceae bacterium]|jgi:putative PIN family toxin of toxin-antitoxin system|nr:putative toxin-antitoxin system toxin component, PIN family [Zoogloeaceae bacterium]